jgi:hypothetical protein
MQRDESWRTCAPQMFDRFSLSVTLIIIDLARLFNLGSVIM